MTKSRKQIQKEINESLIDSLALIDFCEEYQRTLVLATRVDKLAQSARKTSPIYPQIIAFQSRIHQQLMEARLQINIER